jgi:predicted ferric reductase
MTPAHSRHVTVRRSSFLIEGLFGDSARRITPLQWFGGACVLHTCALGGAWWHISGALIASGAPGSLLVALGRLVGLLVGSAVLLQVALVSRLPWIEPSLGCDRLYRLHRCLGFVVAPLFLSHPVLLTFGYAWRYQVSVSQQFIDITTGWPYARLAIMGIVIIVLVVTSSLPPIRRRLTYDAWHGGHLAMYLAIGLASLHQASAAEMLGQPSWGWYWVALHLAVIGALVVFRVGRPVFNLARHRFRIDGIVSESDDVTSVYLTGRRLERFSFRAGQYANVAFLTKGLWVPHPFSFSAAPNGRFLRISIKAVGDFTRRIRHLTPGAFVLLEGPLGAFTAGASIGRKYLLVAGGIGITPIRALIESVAAGDRDVVLLYAARTVNDLVFADELRALTPRCHFILSQVATTDDGHERGRIDRTMLERLVPDVQEREAFVCGPPPMMKSVLGALRVLQVKGSQIHYERFA